MGRNRRGMQIGLAVILTGLVASPAPLSAQVELKRKIKSQVEATYPDIARKYNLSGKVRISLVIGKDGRVKSTKVLGGNAVLANSAQDAVKAWKFLPGPDETTEVIEFDFKGRS